MKKTIKRLTQSILLVSAMALLVGPLEAADVHLFGTNMPPLSFHGFVSQGFLATTKYNYFGNDTKDGSFEFTEAGLNVSMNPFPRTHITAQGFLYDMGGAGKYQPFLDFASIEYTFDDYLGVRAGRIRRPQGIYNDIQDVDLARTYVLLPQGIYDARYRDFSASLDGAELFGNIPLSKVGELSYETYAGYIDGIGADSGVAGEINNVLPGGKVTSFQPMLAAGSQIWWNTPVDGLRFGSAFAYVFDFSYAGTVPTVFPAPFSSVSLSTSGPFLLQEYSGEYLWRNWTFQAEFYDLQITQNTVSLFGTTHSFDTEYAWYGAAAYRFNKWLEIGGYYTEFHVNESATTGSDDSQKDLALSFRFDPKPWWVLKLEGHFIRGTASLEDNADNPVRNDNGWFMILVKTTVSF